MIGKRILDWTPMAYNQRPSRPALCWIASAMIDGRVFLVLANDDDYRGPSITNGVEEAIAEYHRLAHVYDWPEPSHLEYVETYLDGECDFDLVNLGLDGRDPEWSHLVGEWAWVLAATLGLLDTESATLKAEGDSC